MFNVTESMTKVVSKVILKLNKRTAGILKISCYYLTEKIALSDIATLNLAESIRILTSKIISNCFSVAFTDKYVLTNLTLEIRGKGEKALKLPVWEKKCK